MFALITSLGKVAAYLSIVTYIINLYDLRVLFEVVFYSGIQLEGQKEFHNNNH